MMSNFKSRIAEWIKDRYGMAVLMSRKERAARILEEAIEMAQAEGLTHEFTLKVAARTFSRPVGDPAQEGTGVLLTLLAWVVATGVDLEAETEKELRRIESVDPEVSRAKHRSKENAGTAFVAAKQS